MCNEIIHQLYCSQQVMNLKVVLEGIPNKKGEDTEISAVEQVIFLQFLTFY